MPLLNKALVASSLASALLHGALVVAFPFNIGNRPAQDEDNVRLSIRLNSLNIISKPVQESVSQMAEQEAVPEENKAEVTREPQPESFSQPVVATPKPAEKKVIKADAPPEPAKSESAPEVQTESEPFSDDSMQAIEDSQAEPVAVEEQPGTAFSEPANKTDPMQPWLSGLQERINQHRRYPKQAMKRGLEGDVQVKAVINIDGSLASAEVLSGHRSFHRNSLRSLKQALPFPPPAGTSLPVTMVFTIHYKLE